MQNPLDGARHGDVALILAVQHASDGHRPFRSASSQRDADRHEGIDLSHACWGAQRHKSPQLGGHHGGQIGELAETPVVLEVDFEDRAVERRRHFELLTMLPKIAVQGSRRRIGPRSAPGPAVLSLRGRVARARSSSRRVVINHVDARILRRRSRRPAAGLLADRIESWAGVPGLFGDSRTCGDERERHHDDPVLHGILQDASKGSSLQEFEGGNRPCPAVGSTEAPLRPEAPHRPLLPASCPHSTGVSRFRSWGGVPGGRASDTDQQRPQASFVLQPKITSTRPLASDLIASHAAGHRITSVGEVGSS